MPEATFAARGHICHLTLPADSDGLERAPAALALVREANGVVHMPPRLLREALAARLSPNAVLLRADLERDRALVGLAIRDLMTRGLRVAVLKRPLAWIASRRALFGVLPADAADGLPRGCASAVWPRQGRPGAYEETGRSGSWMTLLPEIRRPEEGQALPLALGGCFVLIAAALALVAISGAVTGKGRVQRAADIAAVSAARSMRDDLPRLLSPPTLPAGLPNPAH